MSMDRNRNVSLLIYIIVLGVLGDLLLRAFPWGLNFAIWIACAFGALCHLRGQGGGPARRDMRLFLGSALFFALLFLWRDAPALKLLNGVMVFISIALAVAIMAEKNIRRSLVADYFVAAAEFVGSAINLPFARFPKFSGWVKERESNFWKPFPAVMRGLLISLPLLFVFGWLFVSADALFERLVVDIFDFDPLVPAMHVFTAFACAWMAAAILIGCLEGPGKAITSKKDFFPTPGGSIEVNVVLALINFLFITFVLVQLQYFFGGHEQVLDASGPTYAEYARRGFFELAAVAGFALVLLLICARLLEEVASPGKYLFKILAVVLVVNILIIIASSLYRMGLYVEVYGLTRLRVYTAAFTCWIGIVFLWLAVTIMRDRIHSFAFAFLLSGFAATFILQAINPDALIMRTNIERAKEGKPFDSEYAASLSADAVPTLVSGLSDLPQGQGSTLYSALFRIHGPHDARPLRTWTWGLSRAVRALADYDLEIVHARFGADARWADVKSVVLERIAANQPIVAGPALVGGTNPPPSGDLWVEYRFSGVDYRATVNMGKRLEFLGEDTRIMLPPAEPEQGIYLAEDFNGGNFSENPQWDVLIEGETKGDVFVEDGALRMVRLGNPPRGYNASDGQVGIITEMGWPITDTMEISFDAKPVFRDITGGSGASGYNHPACIDIVTEDKNRAEIYIRLAVNYSARISEETGQRYGFRQAGKLADEGEWIRNLRYRLREVAPEAVRITHILIKGCGWDFDGYVDNLRIFDSSDQLTN